MKVNGNIVLLGQIFMKCIKMNKNMNKLFFTHYYLVCFYVVDASKAIPIQETQQLPKKSKTLNLITRNVVISYKKVKPIFLIQQ